MNCANLNVLIFELGRLTGHELIIDPIFADIELHLVPAAMIKKVLSSPVENRCLPKKITWCLREEVAS